MQTMTNENLLKTIKKFEERKSSEYFQLFYVDRIGITTVAQHLQLFQNNIQI